MRTGSATKGGPEFVRFFAPLLNTLRELGDSGRPKEVAEKIADTLNLPDEVLNRTNRNGGSRYANQVAWARFYLAKAGLIDTSQRGVWTLTEAGRHSQLDGENAIRIFREVQKTFRGGEAQGTTVLQAAEEAGLPPDERAPDEETFRGEMARVLQSLTPEGFERRVLFQCKKHAKQVSPSYVREFRGSMAARADRGIFLATSTFSAEAKREAAREGTAPIEMVDLDAMISLLTDLGLGVTPRTVFAVDHSFFREYGAPEQK